MIVNQDSLETGPQMEKLELSKKRQKNGLKIPDLKRLRNPPSDTNFFGAISAAQIHLAVSGQRAARLCAKSVYSRIVITKAPF